MFVGFLWLMWFVFLIAALFSNEMLRKVSIDLGAVDESAPAETQAQREFFLFSAELPAFFSVL